MKKNLTRIFLLKKTEAQREIYEEEIKEYFKKKKFTMKRNFFYRKIFSFKFFGWNFDKEKIWDFIFFEEKIPIGNCNKDYGLFLYDVY